MELRYRLEQSKDLPGWWVLTDLEYNVVLRFEEHKYNETQKITFLDDTATRGGLSHVEAARIMKEMADYLLAHYPRIALPLPVYEFSKIDDGKTFLLRNKFPRLRVEIVDECTNVNLAAALKKAGEYVKRREEGRG